MFHLKILVRWSGRKRARDSVARNCVNFSTARVQLASPLFFAPVRSLFPALHSPVADPPSRRCGIFTILRVEKSPFSNTRACAPIAGEVSSTQFIPQILRVTFFQWNWTAGGGRGEKSGWNFPLTYKTQANRVRFVPLPLTRGWREFLRKSAQAPFGRGSSI